MQTMRIQFYKNKGWHRQTNPSNTFQNCPSAREKGLQKIDLQMEESDTNGLHDSEMQAGAKEKLLDKGA